MNLSEWSVAELAVTCRQETGRYRRQLSSDGRYCLELFRRVFEEQSHDALHYIYQFYAGLVYHWVTSHPAFSTLDMPAEYFVADSMSKFVLAMQDKSLEDFPNLADVLAYWKSCVNTVVINAGRKRRPAIIPLEDTVFTDQDLDRHLYNAEIWARIEMIITDEKDRVLTRFLFAQQLKPRQIVAAYRHWWADTNEVRVARQRIVRRLQRDDVLRGMLSLD